MELKSNVVFPNLIANGIAKWYLLDYDEFLYKKNVLVEIGDWCLKNDIKEVDVEIMEYFNREDFTPFTKKQISFNLHSVHDFFLHEIVLDGQYREIFLETACMTDYEKIIIYLDRTLEFVLIGLSNFEFAKSFNDEIKPYSNLSLSDRINDIIAGPFAFNPNPRPIIEKFVQNYFRDENLTFN